MVNNETLYPLEHLIFHIKDEKYIKLFIDIDYEVWTIFLKNQPGFISKQVWVNDNNIGEVHSIVTWETLKLCNAITKEDLSRVDTLFTEQFTHEFEIVRRFHDESNYGLMEYASYIKAKGENHI